MLHSRLFFRPAPWWPGFLCLALLCVALPGVVRAQVDGWRSYTSFRSVLDLAAAGESVAVGTTGGLFLYRTADGELTPYTAGQGLHSVQTQALAYDARRDVLWIGYQDGVLDRLELRSGNITSFRDIARSQRFTNLEINRLVVEGDSLLVATAFGLVVFDVVRREVRDTYSQLGALPPATPVRDVAVASIDGGARALWLASGEGIVTAPLSTPNLQDPRAWRVETVGLPSSDVRSVAAFNGQLYAGTAGGLARRNAGATYSNVGITGQAVNDLRASAGRLLGIDVFGVLVVEQGGSARRVQIPGFERPRAILPGVGEEAWVGDAAGGLVSVGITSGAITVRRGNIHPDGPYQGVFSDLFVDASGHLWASGQAGADHGFYRLGADGRWTNYVQTLVPEMMGRSSFERIYVDQKGNAWAGASGGGVVQVAPDGKVAVYDERNSSLRGVSGTTNFILVGGIASDRDANVWITSRGSPAALNVRTAAGEWTALPPLTCSGFSSTGLTYDQIMIDSFGQKWIMVIDEKNFRRTLGLLVLDTRNTPTDTSDDRCRYFAQEGASGQGLPSASVKAVVEDRDGVVWVGTEKGLAFVINNGIVAADPGATPVWPQFADRSRGLFVLSGSDVRDLAVDPANRLWVATTRGVHLVEAVAGGYDVVRSFTKDNSPLPSDVVTAVAVHPKTGRVFFATDRGMVSFDGEAVAPVEQVADLLVYPNPVRVAEGAAPSVFIEGLVEETELRIVAPHGEVVARLSTRGGRARWDARDAQGRLVPSGVYLVVAVGTGGEGAAYGRVAVIR